MSRTLERRFLSDQVEVRSKAGKVSIEGHAALFNSLSQNLGGFVESIRPGAFSKTIQEADVRALFNHNENYVLGRNRSGTLELSEDNTGLYYRITPPDTTYARDLLAVLERGDVSQSSFAFFVVPDQEDWDFTEQDFPVRVLKEVKLVDVSPVTYPAYIDTDSSVGRSAALTGLAKRSGVAVVDLADQDAIRDAIKSFAPSDEPEAPTSEEGARIAAAKARLAELKEMEGSEN